MIYKNLINQLTLCIILITMSLDIKIKYLSNEIIKYQKIYDEANEQIKQLRERKDKSIIPDDLYDKRHDADNMIDKLKDELLNMLLENLVIKIPKITNIIEQYIPKIGRWLYNIAIKGIFYKKKLPDYLVSDYEDIEDITDSLNLELYNPSKYLISIVNLFKNYRAHDFWEDNEIDSQTSYEDIKITIGNYENEIVLKVESELAVSGNLYLEYSKKYIEVLTHVIAKEVREEKAQVIYSIEEQDINSEIAETGYNGNYSYSGDELAFRAALLTRNYNAMREISKEFNIKMTTRDWTVILHDCEDDDYEMASRGTGKTYEEAYKIAEDNWNDNNSDITDESEFEEEVKLYREGLEEPIIPKEIDVSYWSKTNPGKPPERPSLPYLWIRHANDAEKNEDGKKLTEMIAQINDNIRDTFKDVPFESLSETAKIKHEEIMKLMPKLKEVGNKFYETYLYSGKYPKMDDWEEHQKNFINTWWKYIDFSASITPSSERPHPEVFFNESHTYRLIDYIEEYKTWKAAIDPIKPLWDEYLEKKQLWDEAQNAAISELTYNRQLAKDIENVENTTHFRNLDEEKDKVQKKIYLKKRFGCAEEFYAAPTTFIFGASSISDKLIKKIKIKFKPFKI